MRKRIGNIIEMNAYHDVLNNGELIFAIRTLNPLTRRKEVSMTIINLRPHAVPFETETIEPTVDAETLAASGYAVLPEPKPDVAYLAPAEVVQNHPERTDLFVPVPVYERTLTSAKFLFFRGITRDVSPLPSKKESGFRFSIPVSDFRKSCKPQKSGRRRR